MALYTFFSNSFQSMILIFLNLMFVFFFLAFVIIIGKSVDELTEFCKKLSKGESNGYLSNISGDSDVDGDLEKPFHHPFVIKDRGPIVMNIKV